LIVSVFPRTWELTTLLCKSFHLHLHCDTLLHEMVAVVSHPTMIFGASTPGELVSAMWVSLVMRERQVEGL